MKEDERVDVVDKHDEKMRIVENWACRKITIERHEINIKKVELFLEIRNYEN